MIKTIILFKDLCYLHDEYRMSAYYKSGIVLETWTQQWTRKNKIKKAHEADKLCMPVCAYTVFIQFTKYKFYTFIRHVLIKKMKEKRINDPS